MFVSKIFEPLERSQEQLLMLFLGVSRSCLLDFACLSLSFIIFSILFLCSSRFSRCSRRFSRFEELDEDDARLFYQFQEFCVRSFKKGVEDGSKTFEASWKELPTAKNAEKTTKNARKRTECRQFQGEFHLASMISGRSSCAALATAMPGISTTR